jgi:hypothetical protein
MKRPRKLENNAFPAAKLSKLSSTIKFEKKFQDAVSHYKRRKKNLITIDN